MKRSVLFVDDMEDTAELLAECVRRRGYTTFASMSGGDALELVANEAIDVVVTDVMMPGMSGIDLCASLRALRPELMVLLVTGRNTLPVAIEAIRAGAYDYISKPVKIDVLEIAINRAFEH